jgi:hypothetical protein
MTRRFSCFPAWTVSWRIERRLRFRIKADNRRFPIPASSSKTGHASGDHNHNLGLFFHDPFLYEPDYGLVSLMGACYRLVWPFSTPVDSPRDKRERSCSRNHGLRIRIRADIGRFYYSLFSTLMGRNGRGCSRSQYLLTRPPPHHEIDDHNTNNRGNPYCDNDPD